MTDQKKTNLNTDGEVKNASHEITREPSLYKVVLINDDYTTMDFVVEILIKVFNKEPREATKIMLSVHNQGQGICGIYTFDIALSKIEAVKKLAQINEYPLKCISEKA